ncbi:MAG: BatD family protein, partial [Gloeobacteraceae cyanobacterium ES-bin-316]|nr:BatD family protein [Ferruginibacter sp.]
MIVFLKKLLLGCFVSITMLPANGQPKFSAVLTPAQIAKDEYATLRLIVENATEIKNISPPSFKDFVVVSGPNQESGMSTVNGVVNQYIAISYILQPKRAGNLTLASATAKIDGKNYAASPLKLLVKKNSGGHSSPNPFATVDPFAAPTRQPDFTDFILKPGENVPDKVSKNMQLKLQTSKTSCYVGEPIVASYKLYTRLKSDSKLS